MKKFEIGKTYSMRSICDHDCVWTYTVTARTAKTIRDEQNQGYTSPETAKKWGLELGADFMLQGTINSIVDSYKKEQVVYYQVDLELTNLETNEVVWMGDKKIKKQVSDRAL